MSITYQSMIVYVWSTQTDLVALMAAPGQHQGSIRVSRTLPQKAPSQVWSPGIIRLRGQGKEIFRSECLLVLRVRETSNLRIPGPLDITERRNENPMFLLMLTDLGSEAKDDIISDNHCNCPKRRSFII